jgi:hypothetical protein
MSVSPKEDAIWCVLGIVFMFAVWAFGFYACAEKEDQVNRMEARHAQQMMESCR